MAIIQRNKLLAFFVIYGIVVSFLSVLWWNYSNNLLILNIPGMLIGDEAYSLSIGLLGDPSSNQAHFTIPWILRIPQIYVPVSIIFWGTFGLITRLCQRLIKHRIP